MDSKKPSTGEREPQSATLGDVLYADSGEAADTEGEWSELVGSVARGDQLALRALYGRMHRIVYTLMLRIVQNRQTAEELTVDVFFDVWRRAATYDPAAGSVVAWIMNQARSRAIDRLRFEQRKKRVDPHPESTAAHFAARGSQNDVDRGEQGGALGQALTVLTADEREAIETAFFSELTYSETAARLNRPLGTIKTRVRSGLSKLRKALSEDDV